ncbi:MAG: AAA family ATPase [Flavobacterium sp.]|uniref:AAA family ATPase n=1 Tax=Flavobacterium sp. TaxID=239 RepID=UPI0025BB845A|nr:AAA family ATPase [Flavobacterium sp.]MCK6608705.1 AAA family ATPase [Flavobacterium sp.]
MIKLELKNKFKSLEPFQIELPDFVVFTGLNGAGKTQILNAIQSNLLSLTDENNIQLNPKKYVTSQTLSPNNSGVATKEQLNQNIQNLWSQFNQHISKRQLTIPQQRAQHSINQLNQHQLNIVSEIAKFANKKDIDLTADDFYNFYPLNDGMQQIDIFHQNFSNLFKRYQDKLEDNEYRQYKNQQKGDTNTTFLSDEDFLKTYGEPPWLLVNKIISEANLDYHIGQPKNLNRDAPYQLRLVNNNNGAQIDFADLSSGEKVLMSLALALYNSKFDIQFPKVLLMDEPDASLHPSMAQKFINVIKEIFVNEKGVKVIMTTHSPSTVALADECNLFVVNKTGRRIEKASKDYALGILTSGVPSFSINFENRRQVFVESENDVSFYEKLYMKLNNLLKPDVSLTFISSGESRTDKNGTKISNCSQVVNVTSVLRNAGNKFIWGIIDWDKTNKTNDYVKVIGDGKRYSIESYLFDPILLAALLLREKIINREELGLNQNQNYTDFKNLPQDDLQRIIDFIINCISGEFDKTDCEYIRCKYINDIEVSIPKWYLHNNGHDLESKILKIFPKLNGVKKGKEEALKLEIIEKVIDDIPELLPYDVLETFKYIQQ